MTQPASKSIYVSPSLSVPLDAVTESFAIIGRRGSGKTTTASVLAEGMLAAGQQVVIIDPTNAWWGLRSSADGTTPGFEIPVFGGQRSDVPLQDDMGRALANALIETGSSAVVCVRDFSNAGVRRFVGDFAEQLYDRKCEGQFRTPLHLFVDEADAVIPQRIQKGGERAYGAIDKIVRRGRIDGFGTSLISQRPAVIAKDVLTQTEVMIAHQVTGPHDQKALLAWVEEHGEPEQRREFLATLASLKRGEAWFWSPAWLSIFQRVQVRMRDTWNSSQTPKVNEVLPEPKVLAEVDLEAIKRHLAVKPTASKAKGKTGRAVVEELQKDIDAAKASEPTQEQVESAELKALRGKHARIKASLWHISNVLKREMKELEVLLGEEPGDGGLDPNSAQTSRPLEHEPAEKTSQERGRLLPKPARTSAPEPTLVGGLGRGECVILTAILQHHDGCTREQLTVLTGYKRSSRDTYLKKLKAVGFIEASGDALVGTKAGRKAMPSVAPLPTGKALLEHWLGRLPGGEAAVLKVIAKQRNGASRDLISSETSYRRSSRDTYLQKLRARRLIVPDGSVLRLSPTLLDGGSSR